MKGQTQPHLNDPQHPHGHMVCDRSPPSLTASWQHRRGQEGPCLSLKGKYSQPGLSWLCADAKFGRRGTARGRSACAGGGVTRVAGWPLFWALRSQAEAPT